MSNKTQRFFALSFALLFLITTVGFSVLVIIQMQNEAKQQEKQTAALSQANKPKEGDLQGTKLKDFTPVAEVTELQKIDQTVGTGAEVKAGDTVTAHYTGALAKDGIIFQSSHDSGQPIPFGLNEVIKGWTEGVPGMKVGGKRRLLIPSAMAYGEQDQQGIPANSDLVFDIEIVKIGG